jgi:hypothetical protein
MNSQESQLRTIILKKGKSGRIKTICRRKEGESYLI